MMVLPRQVLLFGVRPGRLRYWSSTRAASRSQRPALRQGAATAVRSLQAAGMPVRQVNPFKLPQSANGVLAKNHPPDAGVENLSVRRQLSAQSSGRFGASLTEAARSTLRCLYRNDRIWHGIVGRLGHGTPTGPPIPMSRKPDREQDYIL